ncbi:MAG: hypothetical protein O9293_03405 [Porphyrobacter sp.]|nr:hypothetical protein [Porphyrobacter sp.]
MMDAPPEPPAFLQGEQVIRQSLAQCGLDPAELTYQYDEDSDRFYISVGPASGVTTDHFPCIYEAAGFELLLFDGSDLGWQYDAYVRELLRPQLMAETEGRLKARGLWEGFPARDAFASFGDYLKAIELHVGLEPGTWPKANGDSGITFNPPFEAQTIGTFVAFEQQLGDLMLALWYATARDRTTFSIIGNDKIRE